MKKLFAIIIPIVAGYGLSQIDWSWVNENRIESISFFLYLMYGVGASSHNMKFGQGNKWTNTLAFFYGPMYWLVIFLCNWTDKKEDVSLPGWKRIELRDPGRHLARKDVRSIFHIERRIKRQR